MEAPEVVVADLWAGVVGSMVDRLGHPRMVEVLQKVEDLQGAVVDTPVRSMTEQSLWGVEVLAAMEELGPVLVCAAQEQYHALAAAPVVSSPSMRWRAWRGRRR